jgi:hypothetical protein
MNTANLELEGLYLAMSAVNNLLIEKGLMTHAELRQVLTETKTALTSQEKLRNLSESNRKAICFPISFLLLASDKSEKAEPVDFQTIAKEVGRLN